VQNASPRHSLRTAFLVTTFLALLSPFVAGRITREMPDLEVYWTAAGRAREAEPLYRTEDGHYQFKYLPAFAVLATPLASVTLAQAKAVWLATSIVLIGSLLALGLALLPERRKPAWLLMAATIVAMGKFFGHELVLGQVNLLFGVLAAGALLALKAHRDWAAGGLLALAVVVKPYGVLFLPWLAGIRRLRALAAAAAGVAVALALPIVAYGLDGTLALHRQWWRTVADSTAPNLLNPDNVSVAALCAKWFGVGDVAASLAAALAAGLLGLAAFVVWRRGGVAFPEGLEGSLLLTLIPLLSPQGWDYVLLISTPAIVHLVNLEDRLPGPLRALTIVAVAVIGLSIYDVMGGAAYRAFMSLSMITVCYFVVIAALVTLRIRRIA
jgi:hypothetical protein